MEKNSSQSQQESKAGGGPKRAGSPFDRMGEENLARMDAFFGEIEKLERRSVDQANESIDEAAKLTKDLVEYTARLTAGWRTVAVATTRRATEVMSTPWMA